MKYHSIFLVLAILLVACSVPTATATPDLIRRPVQVQTKDAPLRQGTPGQHTVTVYGWAIDEVTGERIEGAKFLAVTVLGTYEFRDTFEVSFPADTVFQVLAKAEGYADNSWQMKPHYERNIQLEMAIPLSRPTAIPNSEG